MGDERESGWWGMGSVYEFDLSSGEEARYLCPECEVFNEDEDGGEETEIVWMCGWCADLTAVFLDIGEERPPPPEVGSLPGVSQELNS